MNKNPTELLEGAYGLENEQDNIAYYKGFANHYDDGFADAMGYNSPNALAKVFHQLSTNQDIPVADIGCGTGLAALALGLPKGSIDGYDLSPEMLDKAREKQLYRTLYSANLKQPLTAYPNDYGALISAGTFTLGHLGPEDLGNLLAFVRSNGLVCVTVNAAHFKEQGFAAYLDTLQKTGKIMPPQIHTVPIYTKNTHEYAADTAHILSFRKA
ncbi:MAG: methyltransferase domain-containing protein [Rhodobacterales bacterium]